MAGDANAYPVSAFNEIKARKKIIKVDKLDTIYFKYGTYGDHILRK